MTHQEQDNLLLNDILERNYYTFFRNNTANNNKSINISFFYDNDYSDYKIIPGYSSIEEKNNLEQIYKNFQLFLNYYNQQKFNTNINIHDNKIFKDFDFCQSLFDLIENTIQYKSLNLFIDCYKFNNLSDIINKIKILQNKYNNYFIFNILITQIQELQGFNLDGINYKLNILIPPQVPSQDLIQNQKIINTHKFNINSYIEVDSDLWTNEAIEDYLNYLHYLFNNLNDINDIFTTILPINLRDQHVLDNTNCKKNCDFQNSLNILMVDLSINLCHKFQYDDLIIGKYVYNEENNTLNLISKNLINIIMNAHLKRSSTPHCETCIYVNICSGFCFMRSYLKCFNPIIPIQESCIFKKVKYSYIFNELKEKQFKITNDLKLSDLYKNYLIKILQHEGS